ncbi:MAG: R3H domain-containing nucleic acid-binding protein [Cyanobacteriota bacterium]|nr:R3H domain-containing nucleic acid-binding protein [Cyanobacteriota bacterium]
MSNLKSENDIEKLLEILPAKVNQKVSPQMLDDAIEFVLDLGRVPEIRYSDGHIDYLDTPPVTDEDIEHITSRIPEFTSDNRSGIAGTLHRISAIRNRQGKIVGLTCRIGRVVTGTIACIKDLCMQNKSILFLGRPGVGKTTKLREISRLVADELHKRVVIVDTSNEIAGDGDIPHPAVGHARRMQVRQPEFQKDVMIEAVENHTPEVIIVDEIGTEEEAQAARTIAERGVMLIATAHGNTLENLIKNPTLSDLVGGIQSVTLGDDEAKRRASQKTVLEREKQPTFDIVIEILDRNTLAIYKDTAEAVDYILRGWPIKPEIRKVDKVYDFNIPSATPVPQRVPNVIDKINKLDDTIEHPESLKFSFSRQKYVEDVKPYKKIYLYAVSRSIAEKVIERLDLNAEITRNIDDADIVIAHKNFVKGGAKVLSTAEKDRLQIFYVKTNSMAQIQKVIKQALDITELNEKQTFYDVTEKALDETKAAIDQILAGTKRDIELKPQSQQIRKLQHELAQQHNLDSTSVGEGENRHLRLRIVGGTDYTQDKK